MVQVNENETIRLSALTNVKAGRVIFETDGTKLTHAQKRVVCRLVKGHVEDKNYFFSQARIDANRYFVAVTFYYYPADAIDNPYLAVSKYFYVGPKGAIQKAGYKSGIGRRFDITKTWRYYAEARLA